MEQNKKEEDKQTEYFKKLQSAYKNLFEEKNGRLILKDLIMTCYALKPSYVPNSDETVFNEGKRAVFLHIATMANIDIEKLREVRDAE